MNLEKMLKDAYMSGVIEAQVAEQIPNMSFDFEGMANAYAQSKVKELNIPDVVQQSEQLVCRVAKKKGTKDCGLHNLHCSRRR